MDIVRPNGKVIDSATVHAVDELLQKAKTKPMWEVIDLIVKIYLRKYSTDANKRSEKVKEQRKQLKNRFAANKDKSLRHLVSVPTNVRDVIDFFYSERISYDSKRFWREFAKRYPIFSVPERKDI